MALRRRQFLAGVGGWNVNVVKWRAWSQPSVRNARAGGAGCVIAESFRTSAAA